MRAVKETDQAIGDYFLIVRPNKEKSIFPPAELLTPQEVVAKGGNIPLVLARYDYFICPPLSRVTVSPQDKKFFANEYIHKPTDAVAWPPGESCLTCRGCSALLKTKPMQSGCYFSVEVLLRTTEKTGVLASRMMPRIWCSRCVKEFPKEIPHASGPAEPYVIHWNRYGEFLQRYGNELGSVLTAKLKAAAPRAPRPAWLVPGAMVTSYLGDGQVLNVRDDDMAEVQLRYAKATIHPRELKPVERKWLVPGVSVVSNLGEGKVIAVRAPEPMVEVQLRYAKAVIHARELKTTANGGWPIWMTRGQLVSTPMGPGVILAKPRYPDGIVSVQLSFAKSYCPNHALAPIEAEASGKIKAPKDLSPRPDPVMISKLLVQAAQAKKTEPAPEPLHIPLPTLMPRCSVCGAGGKLLACGRCRLVSYCGKKCQQADWAEHKKFCSH